MLHTIRIAVDLFTNFVCKQSHSRGRRRIKNVGDEIKPVSTLWKIDYDILVLR